MTWEIPLAYQSRDQTIREVLEAGVDQELKGDDHRIFFELLLDPRVRVKTMGQLEDHIEGLDPDRGKALLDRLRKSAGLPTASELDDAAALRRIRRGDPPRPPAQPIRNQRGELVQQCSAEDCRAISRDEGGAISPVKARRWWCEAHRDQAAPRDLEPWEQDTVQVDPRSGSLILDPEAEAQAAEFYRRQAEQRAEEHRKRLEAKRAEAERIKVLEEQLPEPIPAPDPYMELHRAR